MPRYVVATVGEIPSGGRKIVEVAKRSIGIFNVGGEFFALRNQCPHEGGPLCEGSLSGLLLSDGPGQYTYLRRGEILRCPWHQWEFDLRTGQSWFDPDRIRTRPYEVQAELGKVLLSEREDEEPAKSGLQKGPFVTETYTVSVDQEYIILEVGD